MTDQPLPWWKTGVVYQIYPRSFADTSGDGVGDLNGVAAHLDHLAWLGVDAIWLSPIFTSPMADFGYDVADYCDVDPLFGTLADLDRLIASCHERGLKLMLDWVPNHTSDQHPWFKEARSSRDNPKRNWYWWRDPAPDTGPPNQWKPAFGSDSAWTLDPGTGQYYLHSFLAEQPDLNWTNPDVRAAMYDTLRFWLDRGVDGFRMDVIHVIGKDLNYPPGTPEPDSPWPTEDFPHMHQHLREIRAVLDEYSDRLSIGEVYLLDPTRLPAYYGTETEPELHLSFNFAPLHEPWGATEWRRIIDVTHDALDPAGAWPVWVLSNHDRPRIRTRYGSEARARAAAVALLTLRGSPYVYAGDEFGLEDAVVPPSRIVDPGGRDGCRAPLPWTPDADHGWPAEPWLPFPPSADTLNAETLKNDPTSILWLYRRLLAARRASPALHAGSFRWIDTPDGVLGWERTAGSERRVVYVNFSSHEHDVAPGGTVEVSSDSAGEGSDFSGRLGPDQAVVLRP